MPTLDFYYRNVLGRRLQSAEMDANNQLYAQAYDTIVSISASVAATANFKGNWSALTGPLTVPASVAHSGSYWMLLSNLADVTAATPGVSASWQLLPAGNVQGPVSSVDGDGVVFDGATGKLTKSLGSAPVKKTGDTMTGGLTFAGTGLRLRADFSDAAASNRMLFQTTVANGSTVVHAVPNGAGVSSVFEANNASDPTNSSSVQLVVDGSTAKVRSSFRGSGSVLPLTFDIGASEALRVDTSRNVLITGSGGLGYGTGSGGTVTQATSKSTSVTLNKPSGRITTNGAALAANTVVSFTFTNSAIAAADSVLVSIGSAATAGAYVVQADQMAAGSCRISLKNISAGSLSEALVLNFQVIKGATS